MLIGHSYIIFYKLYFLSSSFYGAVVFLLLICCIFWILFLRYMYQNIIFLSGLSFSFLKYCLLMNFTKKQYLNNT